MYSFEIEESILRCVLNKRKQAAWLTTTSALRGVTHWTTEQNSDNNMAKESNN